MLAEVVVAPASRMEGRTIGESSFTELCQCAIIGVQRRQRMLRQQLSSIRLEAGDVLIVIGQRQNIIALRDNRDVLLLEWSARDFSVTDRSRQALIIFGAVIGFSATGILPIAVAAMLGAMLVIAGECINVRQAFRAIDRRIVVMVATALAMGTALQATGGDRFLASLLLDIGGEMGPRFVLGVLFLMTAAVTNILSNNATAVLFAPIAIALSTNMGLSPLPFLVTVIFAANCSFVTPIGYQTNLLVMAPGHYKFFDYVKTGLPLTLLLWLVFLAVVPAYYGL